MEGNELTAFQSSSGRQPRIPPPITLIQPSSRRRTVQSTKATMGTSVARNIGCIQKPKPASTPNSTMVRRVGDGASTTIEASRKASVGTSIPDAYAG